MISPGPVTDALSEAHALAEELERLPFERRPVRFFAGLATSGIPWHATRPDPDPEALYREAFAALGVLGGVSVPLAVGLAMHQVTLAAVATFPLTEDDPARVVRRMFLDGVAARRQLVCSAGGDGVTRPGRTLGGGRSVLRVRRAGDGFEVFGRKTFVSLADRADLVTFTAATESGGVAAFVAPLQGNAAIEVGPPEFESGFDASGTRSLTFDGLRVPATACLSGDDDVTRRLSRFQRACFEVLLPAVYLGAARRALEELRAFALSTRIDERQRIADLDGFRAELGRLVVRHRSAVATCCEAGRRLADAARPGARTFALPRAAAAASAGRYQAMRAAEEIVTAVRRAIGTRAMAPGHPVERISREVMTGSLHPTVEAEIEREEAGRFLREG